MAPETPEQKQVKIAADRKLFTLSFTAGLLLTLLSLGILIANFEHKFPQTTHVQEANAAFPWLAWGGLTALAGLLLSALGTARFRISGLVTLVAAGLCLVWLLLAGSAV